MIISHHWHCICTWYELCVLITCAPQYLHSNLILVCRACINILFFNSLLKKKKKKIQHKLCAEVKTLIEQNHNKSCGASWWGGLSYRRPYVCMNWLSPSSIPEIIFISLSRRRLWARGNDELLWPFTWDNLPRLLSGSSLGWTDGRPRPRTWPRASTDYRVKMRRGRRGLGKRGKLAEACVCDHMEVYVSMHTQT